MHPPQPYDYISPSCSYDLILDYEMRSHSNLFINESEKLVVKASSDPEHDMIVLFNDILVEEWVSLEAAPLEEPYEPHDLEWVNPISIGYPLEPFPTSVVMPSTLLFHSFLDP